VLEQLDRERSLAFELGDRALLSNVYVAGSRPLERDGAALGDLWEARIRAVGLQLEVERLEVASADPDEVTLRVVDRMPGYVLAGLDGTVIEVRPGRGPATWLITLRDGAAGWRIAAISPA
jgi:hypothetical protein